MPSRCSLVSALAALVLLVIAAPAGAATFNVSTTQDVNDALPEGFCTSCSLREAVREANFLPSDDVINIPVGTFVLTGAAGEDAAASGDLDLASGTGKLTINGISARSTIINGDDVDRVFTVFGSAVVELSALTVANGKVTGESGGGINNDGTLTLTDVAVVGNESVDGGAIATGGSFTLTRSLVRGNVASGRGGGIQATGSLTLVNSTLSGNVSSGSGAAVWSHDGSVDMMNSTIAANGGGRGLDLEDATATVANSIISGNPQGDCRTTTGGSIATLGGNFAGDLACGFGLPVDPRLGPLADNGGATDTHSLLTGSPAIDAGSGPGCPAIDQRGVPRPQGQACDSGAFEAAPVAVTGPAADTVAPRITALRVSNPVFKVRRRGRAAAVGAPRKRAVPKGTRFRYRLSESGGVGFTIQRRTRGRRVGKHCRATTKRNRTRPRCVRWVAVRRFIRAAVAGPNSVPFSGRIRRGRKVRALRRGRFRASIRATDAAGNRSKVARVSFRVVRGLPTT